MSHLFYTQSLSEPPDNIETRNANRFIDEIEHRLVEFRIGGSARMIEESWGICPRKFLILYESSFIEDIIVSKI